MGIAKLLALSRKYASLTRSTYSPIASKGTEVTADLHLRRIQIECGGAKGTIVVDGAESSCTVEVSISLAEVGVCLSS